MNEEDYFKLLHGPYEPPRTRRGKFLRCEWRGKVKVGEFSDGPIYWPMKWGKHSLILCGDLVRAVRQESEAAVAHHWGVSTHTVWKWRWHLTVKRSTQGTHHLQSGLAKERATPEFMGRLVQLARRPEGRARLSEAKRGKPVHPDIRAALLEAAKRPKSESVKRHMSEGMRKRIARGEVPFLSKEHLWMEEQIKLLGTKPDREIAAVLGRTLNSIRLKRIRLGIPVCPVECDVWTPEQVEMLGIRSDGEVAELTGRSIDAVKYRRQKLKVPKPGAKSKRWTPEELRLLGTKPDEEVAALTGKTVRAVQTRRVKTGELLRRTRRWTEEEEKKLGTQSDREIARLLGRTIPAVGTRRRQLRIASATKPPAMDLNPWTPVEIGMLGTKPDEELAQSLGRSVSSIRSKRTKKGIPCCNPRFRDWKPDEEKVLGTKPDVEVAMMLGRTLVAVKIRRVRLGIAPFRRA